MSSSTESSNEAKIDAKPGANGSGDASNNGGGGDAAAQGVSEDIVKLAEMLLASGDFKGVIALLSGSLASGASSVLANAADRAKEKEGTSEQVALAAGSSAAPVQESLKQPQLAAQEERQTAIALQEAEHDRSKTRQDQAEIKVINEKGWGNVTGSDISQARAEASDDKVEKGDPLSAFKEVMKNFAFVDYGSGKLAPELANSTLSPANTESVAVANTAGKTV